MIGRRRVVVVLAVVETLVVAAAVVLVGLRGNGSEVEATPTVSPSTSAPSSSASTLSEPVATVPPVPAAALAHDRAGAESFFEAFFEAYNYAYAALDEVPLAQLSGPSCRYCAGVIQDIRSSRVQGLRFEAGLVSVRTIELAPTESDSGIVIAAIIDQTAGTIYGSNGKVSERSKAVAGQRVDARVTWSGEGWKMSALKVVTNK